MIQEFIISRSIEILIYLELSKDNQLSKITNFDRIFKMNQTTQLNGQTKDLGSLSFFCKIGQETVQDIVNKTTEMMAFIKTIQLPNGTSASNSNHEEKKIKLRIDYLKSIAVYFKRLYKLYERCLELSSALEEVDAENLIPIQGQELDKIKSTPSDQFKDLKKEYSEQLKILKNKNAKIKEIIDRLREIVWEANTMLAMNSSK